MSFRSLRVLPPLLIVFLALVATPATAAEPPSETGAPVSASLTKDVLAEAISQHFDELQAKFGGYWNLDDPVTGKTLKLQLVKVHRERLSKIAPDTYFACADFKDTEGNTWDVDTFMKGTSKDDMSYVDVSIHKLNGKPRYTWYEEDGIWKKRDVTAAKEKKHEHPSGSEHPEHPR